VSPAIVSYLELTPVQIAAPQAQIEEERGRVRPQLKRVAKKRRVLIAATLNHIRHLPHLAMPLPFDKQQTRLEERSEEMSEPHTLKSLTGISHSAASALRVEESARSEIAAISPFVDKLMLFIRKHRCVPGSELDVEISLREALGNAVVHGNHEDPRKQVYVACRCVPNEEVSIVVRDEGKGFSTTELPNPTAAKHLESTHGRGVYLMKTLMDEVYLGRGGTTVHMRKKSAQPDRPGRRRL
jgi:anti-sigma regulatory factor (Ser/Thr protein kinase)